MGLQCDVCGKAPLTGNKVSHSNKKSPRRWKPNVHKMRVAVKGGSKRMNVCMECLRSGRVVKASSAVKKTAEA